MAMASFGANPSDLAVPKGSSTDDTNTAQQRADSSSFSLSNTGASAPPATGQPISSEDMAAIMNEQPMGATPSSAEMEDRDGRDAQSSVDNLLPRDKLENGLKHARNLFMASWAGLAAGVRELEGTETVGKLKEGTATIIDRSMDGLSKVGSKVAEVTDDGVKAMGAKMEAAAPTIGRWRDSIVIASEGAFASAKEITDKAVADIRNRRGANSAGGNEGGVWGAGGSAPGSGPTSGSAGANAGDDGPHTV